MEVCLILQSGRKQPKIANALDLSSSVYLFFDDLAF